MGEPIRCKFSVDGGYDPHLVGSNINGHVEIDVKEAVEAQDLRVKFFGEETTSVSYMWSDGNVIYPRESSTFQPIVDISVSTRKEGTGSIVSPKQIILPGTYSLPFTVSIPSNLPSSHEFSVQKGGYATATPNTDKGSFGKLSYRLIVEYLKPADGKWVQLNRDGFTVIVGQGEPQFKPQDQSLKESREIVQVCCCSKKYEGQMNLDVSLEPSVVKPEEGIIQPFKVSCQNTSAYPMQVEVYFNEIFVVNPNPNHPEGRGYACYEQIFNKTFSKHEFSWNQEGDYDATQVFQGQLTIPPTAINHSYQGVFMKVEHLLVVMASLRDSAGHLRICATYFDVDIAPKAVCQGVGLSVTPRRYKYH